MAIYISVICKNHIFCPIFIILVSKCRYIQTCGGNHRRDWEKWSTGGLNVMPGLAQCRTHYVYRYMWMIFFVLNFQVTDGGLSRSLSGGRKDRFDYIRAELIQKFGCFCH